VEKSRILFLGNHPLLRHHGLLALFHLHRHSVEALLRDRRMNPLVTVSFIIIAESDPCRLGVAGNSERSIRVTRNQE
jgi:hypothetical protein